MNYLNTKANRRQLTANRYRNARYILFERSGGEIARFARSVQKSHSYVSAYISETPTKRMGEKVARMIETAFGLNQQWLDQERSQSWDRRLREAIGGAIHPLDEEEQKEEVVHDHARWLANLSTLPETGPNLLRIGRQCQHYLNTIQQQLHLLTEQRQDLLKKASQLYEQQLEVNLIAQGYVVTPPNYQQGQVFRVWHHNSEVKSCIQLRLQLTFEPVLQLTPIPPISREVIAMPFIAEHSEQVEFLFIAADERSSPFDTTRLKWCDNALWLLGPDGNKQRDFTARLSLEPLFYLA